jgi:hypothetical protein
MTTILSQDQLEKILSNHVERVIEGFDQETLVMYAMECMRESFRDRGKVDEALLINELFEHEYGEEEPVKDFLMENGVDEDTISDLLTL